jgi:release factor glutamine methyltransferase
VLAGDAVAEAATRLRHEGVDSPRLDAELLLSHLLGANRAAILAWPERQLTPKELTRYREWVARRAAREPLAYIVGKREFYGLDFVVDQRALIPRPETELLVESSLDICRRAHGVTTVADVGAGSGAIAVALAVHLPLAKVYALDHSEGALALVAENALRHGVADRVCCLQGNLLDPLPGPVDLIVANLPYVATEEWDGLQPEIRLYEPRAALDGGPHGLSLIARLLATAGRYVRPSGALLLEIGAGQGVAVTLEARRHFPEAEIRLMQDYAGLDRLVIVDTR